MTCSSDGYSPAASLAYTVRNAFHSIQEWASNQKRSACGNNDEDSNVVVFENGKTSTTFDFSAFEESKASEDFPFLSALRCSAKNISAVVTGKFVTSPNNFDCQEGSDDLSSEGDDQMRRLGSWGTFATLATNESIDTNADTSTKYDDDGNPIDPYLLEKSKRNREKFRVKKRAVKFAYPPISSLKECPRVDPKDLDLLFFTTEELDTYEHDRRSTGTVDDVEIVAVSTSSSDEVPPPPPPKLKLPPPPPAARTTLLPSTTASNSTPSSSSMSDWSQKSGLGKYLASPKNSRKVLAEKHEARGRALLRESTRAKRRATPGPPPRSRQDENTERFAEFDAQEQKPKEKRLLKSVQIFLRARSTGH